jgi:hypothetical protein
MTDFSYGEVHIVVGSTKGYHQVVTACQILLLTLLYQT